MLSSPLTDQGNIIVDDFSDVRKNLNIIGKKYEKKIHRDSFIVWFSENTKEITEVYHIGARTDTTEIFPEVFDRLNFNYSKSSKIINK